VALSEAILIALLDPQFGQPANIELACEHEKGFGLQPIHMAAGCGQIAFIRLLLDRGVPVDARSGEDLTPLSVAAGCGQEETVDLLIENGADIDFCMPGEDHWETPLLTACTEKQTNCAKLLLQRGAKVAPGFDVPVLPIHAACENGMEEIVQMLLDGGSDIEARRDELLGPTSALEIAIRKGHDGTVRLLLNRGASTSEEYKQGEVSMTPLQLACHLGAGKVVDVLLAHDKAKISSLDLSKSCYIAESRGHFGIAWLLPGSPRWQINSGQVEQDASSASPEGSADETEKMEDRCEISDDLSVGVPQSRFYSPLD
jgi:ankyrin repeat protein